MINYGVEKWNFPSAAVANDFKVDHFESPFTTYTTNITIRTSNAMASGIQIGDKTHHQLQSILSSSFNAMKRIASAPVKPIPEEFELDGLFDIVSLLFVTLPKDFLIEVGHETCYDYESESPKDD